MINDVVYFLSNAATSAVNFAMNLFDRTGTWSLVFAGISVILICRFILGPILGFTVSGSSDVVTHAASDLRASRNKRNYDKRVKQAREYKKG